MSKMYFKNFKNSQYEDYNNGVFLYGEKVKARYIELSEYTYKGNSLIEALPPKKTNAQIIDEFHVIPIFSIDERNMPAEYRIDAIYRLMDYMCPLNGNIEVQNNLDIVIRRGYVSKHIASPEYIKRLKTTSNCLAIDENLKKLKTMVCLRSNLSKPSAGFPIIGISGGGKSTSMDKSLTTIPQVIVHEDEGFLFTQITWLKIDCTHNGSIKGICQKFFSKIDDLLGTNYLRMYGKPSFGIDRMIIAMAHLAQLYALGVLIIDEIQHLRGSNNSKSDGEESLNYFVSLMNEINLPIIFIGTYKAIKTAIGKDFRHGRRATGIQDVNWGFIDKDLEWNTFINDLWKYQWTKKVCPLTDEIKDLMYEKTIGITDRVIKLFAAVQLNAITTGKEIITSELINKVAKEKFMITKKMIEAFEKKDLELLSQLDDLKVPEIQELVDEAKTNCKVRSEIQNLANNEMHNRKLKRKEISNEIVVAIANLGYEYNKIEKVVESVIEKHGIKKDINFLKKEVIKLLLLKAPNTDDAKDNALAKKEKKETKKQCSQEIEKFKNDNVKDIFIGITNKEE